MNFDDLVSELQVSASRYPAIQIRNLTNSAERRNNTTQLRRTEALVEALQLTYDTEVAHLRTSATRFADLHPLNPYHNHELAETIIGAIQDIARANGFNATNNTTNANLYTFRSGDHVIVTGPLDELEEYGAEEAVDHEGTILRPYADEDLDGWYVEFDDIGEYYIHTRHLEPA